ncbi:coenzyme F390 synthetase [Legionella norrlandica]|uniref:Coenzyme F390 synthetase n=1 Tax=Legionella norrlandica TaxID=1498499 RepID=A0A0A2T9L7_9GAMM|nr:F390 synthetase-related protein [Legionella norrlandica]KGP64118.1 coenzyme F390 synthetase [Legionella norrlandica]
MLARILYYYYKTLYLKYYLNTHEQLIAYQNKKFHSLVQKTLVNSPFYKDYLDKPFHQWPIMNKTIMNHYFDEINTVKIKKSDALTIALTAEETRNFSPLINDIAIGLSSGTSGTRGLFLTSPRERDAWTGIILAKVLPHGLKTKERIAFFLRANNQLYMTLNKSRKIQFHFFDLLHPFEEHLKKINALNPTIVSAPSSVLRLLAQNKNLLTIRPKKIVAVAEVLEQADEEFISKAFNLPVSQVYQCTEGFLAASDKSSNSLVMNEEFLIIEKDWIDEQRFVPIITDLMRTSQPIIRYRLDDVLIAKKSTGVFTELSAIEGRLGDVCYGQKGNEILPIFADALRQKMTSSPINFDDYRICQNSLTEFTIQVFPEINHREELIRHLNQLFINLGCDTPTWLWQPYKTKDNTLKHRRIQSRYYPGVDCFKRRTQ